MARFGRVVFAIQKGRFSCDNIVLKIAGDFVGVMSCGKTPRNIGFVHTGQLDGEDGA